MRAGARGVRTPRFLFIDAYDSFSNNIIALLHESLTTVDQQPVIEKITIDQAPYWPIDDNSKQLFLERLSTFDAVIAGPGPGDPSNPKDVGLFRYLWSLPEAYHLPILGICLGFQSMCLDAGASVVRLAQGRHGIVTDIDHCNRSIFANIGRLQATHYHSLHVSIGHPIQTGIGFHSSAQMWKAPLCLPRIVPLAWDCSPPTANTAGFSERNGSKSHNGAILMAAQIESRPWWGVQYHPESICSGKQEAKLLIANWWKEAEAWSGNRADGSIIDRSTPTIAPAVLRTAKRPSPESHAVERPLKRLQTVLVAKSDFFDGTSNVATDRGALPASSRTGEADSDGDDDPPDVDEEDEDEESDDDDWVAASHVRNVPAWFGGFSYSRKVMYEKIFVDQPARERVVQHVRDLIDIGAKQCIVLESGQTDIPRSTGRYSIIGLVDETAIKICYYRAARTVIVFHADNAKPIFVASGVDFGAYWRTLKKHFHAEGGYDACPFWGGSFLCHSYEACLDTIQASLVDRSNLMSTRPDIFGVVIMRSIVVDHHYHDAFVQSIAPADLGWVQQSADALMRVFNDEEGAAQLAMLEHQERVAEDLLWNELHLAEGQPSTPSTPPTSRELTLKNGGVYVGPSRAEYERKVERCQEYIAAGDSYELCLTGRTSVHLPLIQLAWLRDDLLYRNLTQHNPAPFGARIQLTLGQTGVTIFSSSPERFLCWDRGKKCEFRPIKGTLRKTKGMTKDDARDYFTSPKERAENLMITDLIRHDLYGVLQHPDSVRVPPEKLFAVEEYSTVYQLVTSVEGRFRYSNKTGIDVLNASLPPGSMTGAPKKRSCELLQQIEDFQARGLYSGVIGYDDVGGGGDFSVLIRAAVRWDNEILREEDAQGTILEFERWTLGAGGAVTALSNPTDEYNEMITKRNAVLQAFLDLPGRLSAQS